MLGRHVQRQVAQPSVLAPEPSGLDYLRHHLALAGRTEPLFADDAMARLHQASLGLPCALNNLARDAIIAAAAANKDLVDDLCAERAVAELTAHEGGQPLAIGAG